MKSKLILCLSAVLILLTAPLVTADDGLMTYDRFLQIRDLDPSDLQCINEVTEPVIHPRTQVPELNKVICEVWIKEKTIPAQRLTYRDGTPVYKTTRSVRVPTTTTATEQFMVKQDTRRREEPIKRYVIEAQ